MGARTGKRRPGGPSPRLQQLHTTVQAILDDLPSVRAKPLWGGLGYRYGQQVAFHLTLRPRTVLVELKLPVDEADLAMRQSYIRPHSFTRLARTGWVAISLRPDTPLAKTRELVERSYEVRIQRVEDRRRMGKRRMREDFF